MKRINFENAPSTNTPIDAANLNLLQDNIEETMTYFSEEQIIGYWYDGRPVYRRVFEGTTASADGAKITADITAKNSEPLWFGGYIGDNERKMVIGGYVNTNFYAGLYINDAQTQLWLGSSLYNKPYKIIIIYLKIT